MNVLKKHCLKYIYICVLILSCTVSAQEVSKTSGGNDFADDDRKQGSAISLEGKTFNILKSLPVKPYTIIKSKILAALLIMLPCIFIGDLIVFIKFQFNLLSMLLIIIASVLLPLISATIGIIINLKFPKMDAQNDTEVVKQSRSSAIRVFIGMVLAGISVFLLFKLLDTNISNNNIMMIFIFTCTIIYSVLSIILHKICDKCFNDIIV